MDQLYKSKDGVTNIPVDLIYFNKSGAFFHAFEVKSGGNLDTKNSDANHGEVLRLAKLKR